MIVSTLRPGWISDADVLLDPPLLGHSLRHQRTSTHQSTTHAGARKVAGDCIRSWYVVMKLPACTAMILQPKCTGHAALERGLHQPELKTRLLSCRSGGIAGASVKR
jgi:hypothetical protein